MREITINVNLPEDQADAFAQYLKRIGFSEFRSFAKTEEEAYDAQAGAEKVLIALASAGIDAR